MAAAYFNRLAAGDAARAISAGTQPGDRVHPEVVDVMREDGIDLSHIHPQRLTPELAAGATLLVTMGCAEECPAIPGAERLDWPLPDPRGQSRAQVRGIRDEIRLRVTKLLTARGWSATPEEKK